MFIVLLIVSFAVSFLVCVVLARVFRTPINKILKRLVGEDIYTAWTKYITFAVYVVGISGGVRVWKLEQYITVQAESDRITELTTNHWVLEIYRTVIGTLQSVAWMLLVFFLVALIAFVIVKGREFKRQAQAESGKQSELTAAD